MRINVIPAYGRDYNNKKAVQDAWKADKDFLVADISSPWDRKPVNRGDVPEGTMVQARYAKLRKVVVFRS